ncbi:hypothetical protein LBMAG53_38110 [Planctomycetota bacterium]|nr:hypothetical protein LBMAG53_38110 [Planctomycetota bacterium]
MTNRIALIIAAGGIVLATGCGRSTPTDTASGTDTAAPITTPSAAVTSTTNRAEITPETTTAFTTDATKTIAPVTTRPTFIPFKEDAQGAWAAAPFIELKKAKMVAELDASRMLAERLYGSVLFSTEVTRDRLPITQIVEAVLSQQARLIGVTTTNECAYADGRYSIELSIGWVQAVQTVREEGEKSIKNATGELSSDAGSKEVLRATGWAGLPGSDGWRKTVALRAAQTDAQRALAQRIGQALVEVFGKVELGALVNKGVARSLAVCLAGGRYGEPTFRRHGDGWIAVASLSVAKANVVEAVKIFTNGDVTKLEFKDIETFTEDGSGSDDGWKDLLKGTATPSIAANSPAGTTVVERILGEIIIIR